MQKLAKGLNGYWHSSLWHRIKIIAVLFVFIVVGLMYGIAQWYIWSERHKPLELGVSFIPDYAQSLGLEPEQTLDSLLGIGVKHFRLVSYWSDGERTKGQYDFSQLDWEFKKAETAHAHVILTVGLRQPRWPECHMPDWASKEPVGARQSQLEQYMSAVIERYKTSPALESYQLENEFFLKGFGICDAIPGAEDRAHLVSEYNLIKKLDPGHQVIVGRSNNAVGFPVGQPQPDEFSISVYKRVWDAAVTHRYIEYPYPAWFYGFLAGTQKIFNHKDMIIGELQAEAWPPNGQSIQETSLAEQSKSIDAHRLKERFSYAEATGMRGIYFWGAEYWYYRAQKLHDPSLWNVAKQEFSLN